MMHKEEKYHENYDTLLNWVLNFPVAKTKREKLYAIKIIDKKKIFSFFLALPLKEKGTLTNINKNALNSSCTVIILCLSPTVCFREIDSVKSPIGRTWNNYNWWNFQGSCTQQGPETHMSILAGQIQEWRSKLG